MILKEHKGGKKNRKQHIKATMAKLLQTMGPQHNRLFLVGGSWRAFAKIDMLRRGYPLHVMHEYRITLSSVKKTIKFIEGSELEEIVKNVGSRQRELNSYQSLAKSFHVLLAHSSLRI